MPPQNKPVRNNASGQHAVRLERQQINMGPIPPPSILEKFEQLVPGSAKQIIDNAHEESQHRRKMEASTINHEISLSRMGLITAALLSLGALSLAAFMVYTGQSLQGLALVIFEISGLGYVFHRKTRIASKPK